MKIMLALAFALLLTACGRNEPGTMGGEPGAPETVATGAPAMAASETSRTDPQQPALASEHASSTYDDPARTNVPITTRPDASTRNP